MIQRTHYLETIRERLKRFPVVSVLGPRQVGKTTLAQQIAGGQPSHFFDLEDVDAQARLAEPKVALERLTGLVVLDEVQRMPELFALLFVIHPGKDSYEMNDQTEAVAIANLQARLVQAGIGGKGRS